MNQLNSAKYIFLFSFWVFICNGQIKTSNYSINSLKTYTIEGIIGKKYKLQMQLYYENQNNFEDWEIKFLNNKEKSRESVMIQYVMGSYSYENHLDETIFLNGKSKHYINRQIDSLELFESSPYGVTGKFNLKLTNNTLTGKWTNLSTGVIQTFSGIIKNEFSEGLEIFSDECNAVVQIGEGSSFNKVFSRNYDNKTYYLFDVAFPHCGIVKSFGACCGGYDNYVYLYEVSQNCTFKLLSKELIMDCENRAEYFELKSGLDEKIKLTKSMIDLATGSLGTILFIDANNITKGIQKKKK
jgi:hypothetical protein